MSELPKIYPGERPHHIIEAQQFTPEWLVEDLFPKAVVMEIVADERGSRALLGKRVKNLFYEASSRTLDSFESAAELLGATFSSTSSAGLFSSAVKGESLNDSIKVRVGYRYDCIVLRHNEEGAAARAATASSAVLRNIPVINGGDGPGQHPTQALLDVYTIYEQFGTLNGLRIGIEGDLTYGRTTHSLTYLMSKFPGVRFDFVSPPELGIRDDIREYLDRHGVAYDEHSDLTRILPQVDVLYVTRQQLERVQSNGLPIDYSNFVVNLEAASKMQPHAIILHPLPRNQELPEEVDNDPRAKYFRQAENGLFVRMALLDMILGEAA